MAARVFGLLLFLAATLPLKAQVSPSSQELAAVDSYVAAYWPLQRKNDASTLVALAKGVANRYGVSIIPALLAESEKLIHALGAGGEEPLILVPIVIQLPVPETTRRLKAYEASGTETQKLWAREFLTEMEAYAEARKKGQPSW